MFLTDVDKPRLFFNNQRVYRFHKDAVGLILLNDGLEKPGKGYKSIILDDEGVTYLDEPYLPPLPTQTGESGLVEQLETPPHFNHDPRQDVLNEHMERTDDTLSRVDCFLFLTPAEICSVTGMCIPFPDLESL